VSSWVRPSRVFLPAAHVARTGATQLASSAGTFFAPRIAVRGASVVSADPHQLFRPVVFVPTCQLPTREVGLPELRAAESHAGSTGDVVLRNRLCHRVKRHKTLNAVASNNALRSRRIEDR